MLKKSFAAAKKIVAGRAPHTRDENSQFYFKDKSTGRIGVTDSFSLVMYGKEKKITLDELKEVNGHIDKKTYDLNAMSLFERWVESIARFDIPEHDYCKHNTYSLKEILDLCKNKKNDKNLICLEGHWFNATLVKDVAEAMDTKDFTLYLPQDKKAYNIPLMLLDNTEDTWGLVMQVKI